jgi:hypothetical protein
VAKGYTQRYGKDCLETFAPIAKIQTFRLLLTLVVLLRFELHQMDVITAFLNCTLNEEIYMGLPEGYEKPGCIAQLLRSLYGLSFVRSFADEALYMKKDLWILLYVDDLFIAGKLPAILDMAPERFVKVIAGSPHLVPGLEKETLHLALSLLHLLHHDPSASPWSLAGNTFAAADIPWTGHDFPITSTPSTI